MRERCSKCEAKLTDSDLREGPNHPEVGYVYYKCPECGHLMPGPSDASPSSDAPSYLPSDDDWRENPRDYHDQMDLREAVADIIEDLDNGEGVARDDVTDEANSKFELLESETDDIINDLMMSARCYEPDDGFVKTL